MIDDDTNLPLSPEQIDEFTRAVRKRWYPEPVYQTEFARDITEHDWLVIGALANALLPGGTAWTPVVQKLSANPGPTNFSVTVKGPVEARYMPSAEQAGVLDFLRRALDGGDGARPLDGFLGHRVPEFLYASRQLTLLARRDFDRDLHQLNATAAEVCVLNFERDNPALFAIVRQHILEGYFADPRHGGNKDYAAWKSIDLDSHILHEHDSSVVTNIHTPFDPPSKSGGGGESPD